MKKIIVFLSMFLFAGGILLAQTPQLSYEVLLRDRFAAPVYHDNDNKLLFSEQPVTVHVSIFDLNDVSEATPLYEEDLNNLSTDQNGLLSVAFGADVDWAAAGVDWSNARIRLDIDCNGKTVTHDVPVYAVPYAMQSGNVPNALTTEAIIDYIGRITFQNDGRRIFRALHENPNGLEQSILDSITSYVKHHKDDAKWVAIHYLGLLTQDDVQQTYDAVLANGDAYNKGVVLLAQYGKEHIEDAIEIAEYFINNYVQADDENYVKSIINKIKANTEAYPVAKAFVEDIFKEYLDEHHYLQKTDCPDVDACTIH